MAVIVEFSIIPMREGTSVSKLIAPAIKELEKRGVKACNNYNVHDNRGKMIWRRLWNV